MTILLTILSVCLIIISTLSTHCMPSGLMRIALSPCIIERLVWWILPSVWTVYAVRYFESGAHHSLELQNKRKIIPHCCSLIVAEVSVLLPLSLWGMHNVVWSNRNGMQMMSVQWMSIQGCVFVTAGAITLITQFIICRRYTELSDLALGICLFMNIVFMQYTAQLGRSMLSYGAAAISIQIIMPTLGRMLERVVGTHMFRIIGIQNAGS